MEADCEARENVGPCWNDDEEGFEGEALVVGACEEEVRLAGGDGSGYEGDDGGVG